MPGTLPYLSSGNVAMLPIQFGYSWSTGIARFQNGAEQRFQGRPQLARFQLVYTNVSKADRDQIDLFFETQRGSFDTGWTFILNKDAGGLLQFPSCTFDQDVLEWTENRNFPNYYSTTIQFHQTAVGGAPNGKFAGTFPPLGPPVDPYLVTGYPFVSGNRFSVARVDLPSGPRYAHAWYAAGLPNFPSRALKSWTLNLNSVDYSIVAAISQHYIGCLGKYWYFAFNDPTDGKQYKNVRYDMDALTFTSRRMNNYSAQIKLVEFYGQGWTA